MTQPQPTLPFFSWIFLQCAAHSLEKEQRRLRGRVSHQGELASTAQYQQPAQQRWAWQIHALMISSHHKAERDESDAAAAEAL